MRRIIFILIGLLPVGVMANTVSCDEINKQIEDKTKFIAFEKVFEVERSKAVNGTMFIPSKKIPQYQSEISMFMQQGKDMSCPPYSGDLTGKPYFSFAKKCAETKFRDRQSCDKENWVINPQ
ncbi:hypothetical protein [Acinetobacter junii]|uniref:hypothetical protein n=1 Tax=Acinetobacter junii TaxID=40215 RepID=UPI0032B609A0